MEKALEQIDDALNGVDADKKMKVKVRRVRKSWPEQLRKYESQGKILDGRNSYSKTDNDATFMRMKEDYMKNGQLKPGYNPQISPNKQFILNYTLHQCAGDTSTYPLHMDDFHSLYGRYPDVSVCDAGYGSEENYLYAFKHGIETFIKYNYFHKEQKRSFKNDPFLSANFYYNEETDGMYCPMGQRMERLSDAKRVTDNVFVQTIGKKVKAALKMVGMTDYEYRDVDSLSGGQQQRVAIARAIVNEPEVLLLDEPLAALDLKMRKDMQMELKEMHKSLGITFVYVTHDQEEALTLSDTIVVMSEGKIQQIGTPIDIYNEPINSFVANFIEESNILNGTMIHDKLVRFCGTEFECVDEGFGENTPVDVVIRPEDLYIFPVSDMAQLTGVVQTSIFKGVHYEMTVLCGGYEFLVQDYHHFEVGAEVGLLVKPFDIHIMKKERGCNTFEGKLLDTTHVEFLGCNFECVPVEGIESNEDVKVEVDFDKVVLQDNEEDGTLTGEVKFILYKGDHYHLTVFSDWDENLFVDTNDVWDDGDRVGITIPPDAIRVIKITD